MTVLSFNRLWDSTPIETPFNEKYARLAKSQHSHASAEVPLLIIGTYDAIFITRRPDRRVNALPGDNDLHCYFITIQICSNDSENRRFQFKVKWLINAVYILFFFQTMLHGIYSRVNDFSWMPKTIVFSFFSIQNKLAIYVAIKRYYYHSRFISGISTALTTTYARFARVSVRMNRDEAIIERAKKKWTHVGCASVLTFMQHESTSSHPLIH